MTRLNIRAVVFDMDGLVLDSESGYFAAWQKAANLMGHKLDQAFCFSLSGTHGSLISQQLMQHFGSGFDTALFFRLSNDCWRERVQQHGIPVKAGFFELLQLIRGLSLPFCLATNSRRQDAEQALAWAGLSDIFPTIVAREDVENPKPAADVFLKAAVTFNLLGQDCLVLEDSPIGIKAAVAANCPCVFVPSIQPVDENAARLANWVLPDLSQVADFIAAEFEHSV